MFSLKRLKEIARNRVRAETSSYQDTITFLKRWWSSKYNLPDNHPLLLEKYEEELLIEYFEDVFSQDEVELDTFEKTIGKSKKDRDEEWFKEMLGEEYQTAEEFEEIQAEVKNKGDKQVIFDDNYDNLK